MHAKLARDLPEWLLAIPRPYLTVRFRPRDEPPEPLFSPPNVNYPSCDGRPLGDDTLQCAWVLNPKGNLDALFHENPNVSVAGNLLWYPVEGRNRRRLAPDAMVAFGRPKGFRLAYVQHEEGGVPPRVVFEVLSPTNGKRVMDYKRRFYDEQGVEEYYVIDPYRIVLEAWIRERGVLRLLPEPSGWVSPLTGIRFEVGQDVALFHPGGWPFRRSHEVLRVDPEAERRAREIHRERAEVRERIERMEAQVRALGIDPDECTIDPN